MKIAIFEAEPREREVFQSMKPPPVFVEAPLRADNAARYAGAEIISPFIYSQLDADVLAQFGTLKLIATRSTGFDHVLLHLPNVIVTPHSAFNTREAIGRIATTTRRNIEVFVAGAPQNTIVPPPRGKS
jgi:lactate dehydrogenase-like 2-hydroxyacid dehydrogenase